MAGKVPERWSARTPAVATALLVALGGIAIAPAPVSGATTFVVNRVGDQADLDLADNRCDTSANGGNQCTLRAAIQEANDTPGADTINFNITSASKVIRPATPLPPITQRVTINGYSQPGTSANTRAVGNDAVLRVVLDGVNAPTGTNALEVGGRRSVIRGLVIQRFGGSGILVTADEVVLRGNFVGTNATGNVDRGNDGAGMTIHRADAVVIGGSAPSARNLISGNESHGIQVNQGVQTLILGNYIGTNAAGAVELENFQSGILLDGGSGHTVGGAETGEGNLISGNHRDGIVAVDATNSIIAGNLIGTDATGMLALGNGSGISLLNGGGFVIGGTTVGARNTIADGQHGIDLTSSDGNFVQGNRIGTRVDGTGDLGNRFAAVWVDGENNMIGGAGSAGNVIANSANTMGVFLTGPNNTLQGNTISGNNTDGVAVNAGDNQILRNAIIANGAHGVRVSGGTSPPRGVLMSGNVFIGNAGLGIQLEAFNDNEAGVSPNDTGDGDGGPNRLQNYPVPTSALRQSNGVTIITGSLNSVASTEFRIELFLASPDPSGHGEAQAMLGSQVITTNSSGNKGFAFAVAGLVQGHQLSATATNTSTNDTSEFSANWFVVNVPD